MNERRRHMIIIGEKINSSSKHVQSAIDKRDSAAITALALAQREAGAAYIDINAGIFSEDEPERLAWLVSIIQEKFDTRFSLDTSNSEALQAALAVNRNKKPLVNSITAQEERFRTFLPLIIQYKTSVVALCIDDTGLPGTADGRVDIAARFVERLTGEGVRLDDIFLDPVIRPIGTDPRSGVIAIETIAECKKRWPGIHILCGISNISYGIPARSHMNRTFLAAAAMAGLDAAILDPLDCALGQTILAINALTGADTNCAEYIKNYREGALN